MLLPYSQQIAGMADVLSVEVSMCVFVGFSAQPRGVASCSNS